MTAYVLLKYIHILAAIVAVGTNVTYLYWLRRARTTGPVTDSMLQGVQWLDRRLANPAYIVLPVSGIIMVIIGDLGFTTFWIATAIALYVVVAAFAGIAFSPALRRQVQFAGGGNDADYAAAARRTVWTGSVILVLVAVIEFLMVVKPS